MTDESAAPAQPSTVRRLGGYFWPQRWSLAVSIGAFVLAAATEPAIPWLLKKVLDEGFLRQPTFPLWTVPVVLILLFLLRGLFGFVGSYMLNRGTSRAVLQLRLHLCDALLRADPALFGRVSPGMATAKVIHDPQSVAGLLGGAMMTLLRDGLSAVAMLVFLFWQNWQLSALSLISVPLLAYGVRKVKKRINEVGQQAHDAMYRLVNVADDIVRAWRVIRTFDAGHFEAGRFEREARRVQSSTMKSQAASALMTPVSQLAASLGVAAIVTLALYQAQRDGTTVGEFTAYVGGLLLLVSRTRHLTDLSQPVSNALIAARSCFDLMDAPREPDEGQRTLDRARGHLRLRNLSVSYPGAERPTLDRLDMDVPAGATVALVGSSGAGKTTLVNALLGFVQPHAGELTLDGIPVHELRKTDLRRQFAVVSQDIVLFDAPIADNVVYAQPRDDDKVRRCLQAAALWDFVSRLPQGLATTVGVNGSQLSGGQRQRLAIARALYKDAPIWILDEATSALDTESERAIQQALAHWHGQKTMVVIAHRLSTIRDADVICVMDEGRVVESGSHAELLARQGRYAAMVRAQNDE